MLLWVASIPYNIAGCSDAGSPATATAAAATLPDEHDERTLAVIPFWIGFGSFEDAKSNTFSAEYLK